jgi:hypothetical protein
MSVACVLQFTPGPLRDEATVIEPAAQREVLGPPALPSRERVSRARGGGWNAGTECAALDNSRPFRHQIRPVGKSVSAVVSSREGRDIAPEEFARFCPR